jgi:putative cell wall-binding protein
MHHSTKTGLGRNTRVAAGLAAAIVLLGACATTPPAPPTASLIAAQQAIARAEQADAQQYASAELDEAKQKLALADRAVTAEGMIEADRFAQESRVAAELASARTESAKAADINREMGRGADALLEEMQRQGDQL